MASAATKFVTVNGARVATRSVGTGEPLVLRHRFRGTLDDWDPALLSALSRERRVITFDSVGVGETDGDVPTVVEPMADLAASVIRELGLGTADVLGYSLGGFVAQVLAIKYPQLVRKLVLAATMPPGGIPNAEWSQSWLNTARAPVPSPEIAMSLFYTETASSRSAGAASFGRMASPPASYVSPEAMAAQARAIGRFADGEDNWSARLKEIIAPTFVANGDRDGLFPAIAVARRRWRCHPLVAGARRMRLPGAWPAPARRSNPKWPFGAPPRHPGGVNPRRSSCTSRRSLSAPNSTRISIR